MRKKRYWTILKSDIDYKIQTLGKEISKETNAKSKARLVEEQAAYKLVLRDSPQEIMEKVD